VGKAILELRQDTFDMLHKGEKKALRFVKKKKRFSPGYPGRPVVQARKEYGGTAPT